MIPPCIDPNCPSPGELEIFEKLKNDAGTQSWIVLHSLDIANHIKKTSGESDFVVIIPSKGVLCIEVKACSSLCRERGQWYYGMNAKPDTRGPFRQASEAMHSIRNRVIESIPHLSGVVFWSAVIFPYINFCVQSDEWHDWQVIDSQSLRSKPINNLLVAVLDKAKKFLQSKQPKWISSCSELSSEQSKMVMKVLRPSFEFYESPKTKSIKLERELKFYTEEQFLALDAMEINSRVVFEGPAGTGKTLLAIEAARRACSSGKKILFVCFNRFLGKWLKDQTEGFSSNLNTKTIHKHMLDVSGLTPPQDDKENTSFWATNLPEKAIDRLLNDQNEKFLYDEIIVDEAQDILWETYLDFLDISLKRGLTGGRWRFLGDFEKQTIYNTVNMSLEDFIKERSGHAPVYSLRVNCRNTPRIASMVHILGGLNPHYNKILRPDDGIEPELMYFSNNNEQKAIFIKTLENLYKGGLTGSQVVVLSVKADESCVAKLTDASPWKERLKPYETLGKGYIYYCSIHAFKGLEAPVVIITDIEKVTGFNNRALFYVAMTRALKKVIILANHKVKNDILSILLKGKGT